MSWVERTVSEGSGNVIGKLKRQLPMYHPRYDWLWADRITIRGLQFKGNDVNAVQFIDQITPMKWNRYLIDVDFSMKPYQVLGDTGINNEWDRYTFMQTEQNFDLVTVLQNNEAKFIAPTKAFNSRPMPLAITRQEKVRT